MAVSPQTVLITGAARRIGRALSLDLAVHGWAVAVHYHRSADEAAAVVHEIHAQGGRAETVRADLGDIDQIKNLIPQTTAKLGPLTCLINNASLFEHDDVDTLTQESWDGHLNINLRAPAFLAQSFAAQLPDNTPGNIINVIDQRVWRLTPRFLSYTISKAGLWTLTRTLAQSLAPRIRVNAIGPGPTLANERQTPRHFEHQKQATILKRGTTPEEICEAVRFILAAPAMTGQMIALDSGQHLAWETPDIVGIPE